jgi:eukaryotic-like serine/threonine-protein kinase
VSGQGSAGGFTPKYTPPEVLVGKVDIRSDQYSLALVYAELLTGQFPYTGRSANQLMMQHMQGTPDLTALTAGDRAAVGRALAKDPAGRFPSCTAFVRELTTPDRPGSSLVVGFFSRPNGAGDTPPPPPASGPQAGVPTVGGQSGLTSALVRPQDRQPPPPPRPIAPPADPFADLTPVMPADRLHRPTPRALDLPGLPVLGLVDAVVQAAIQQTSPGGPAPAVASEQVRFLSTMPLHMMPYKLVIVAEQWGLSARHADLSQVILRKEDRDPAARGGKPAVRGGYEVTVKLPPPPGVEVTASARLFGSPDRGFVKAALGDIPVILEQVRAQLQNLKERRLHPRHPFDTPVRAFPLFTDGQVGPAAGGRLIDVSLGGIRFVTPAKPDSDRLFVQFPDVPAVGGLAVYTRVLRSHPADGGAGVVTVCRFRRGD